LPVAAKIVADLSKPESPLVERLNARRRRSGSHAAIDEAISSTVSRIYLIAFSLRWLLKWSIR